MDLVDTHCHIQSIGTDDGERITREMWSKNSDLDANGAITAAGEQGVTKMICVGCDLDDSKLAIGFVQERPQCWASVGIHPHEAKRYVGESGKLAELEQLVRLPKVVAVGETGLDYHYEHSNPSDQLEVFKWQVEIARENDLPVIFHIREAFDDFWDLMDNYAGVKGVLHSFTDNNDNLLMAIERGFYIGVNGIATFTKSEEQLEVYKNVPIDKLLLETDAPFLTPKPFRGNINEPKQIGVIADFLAELRGEDRQLLATATTENASRLFGI